MAALTTQQEREVAAYWANYVFGAATTVSVNLDDIQAAVHALDAHIDKVLSTLTQTDTVLQSINKAIPTPVSGFSVAHRTLLVSHTILKRSELI